MALLLLEDHISTADNVVAVSEAIDTDSGLSNITSETFFFSTTRKQYIFFRCLTNLF